MCIQNLKTLALKEAKKFVTNRKFDWRERKRQIKEMISRRRLILFYTIQQVIPNICTKFQNPRRSSSREIFDTNFTMYYIGVRNGKMGKRRQKVITESWFSFPQYSWPISRYIQNSKTDVIGAENSVTIFFFGEKEKRTNKRNDKLEEADSLLHNTTSHTRHLYQISKS